MTMMKQVFMMLCLLMSTIGAQAQEIWEATSVTDLTKDVQTIETSESITLTGEATAAIAMSLHLYYNGIHDDEGPKQVTIKKVERRYSPWNSKLYGMNNLHRF